MHGQQIKFRRDWKNQGFWAAAARRFPSWYRDHPAAAGSPQIRGNHGPADTENVLETAELNSKRSLRADLDVEKLSEPETAL